MVVDSKRKSNFELLRIFAMLMIIGYHLCVHGIMNYMNEATQFQTWITGSFINKVCSVMLFPGGEVGVALYFIISGYFCVFETKRSVSKVVYQTLFYGLFSCLIFFIFIFIGNGNADISQFTAIKRLVSGICIPVSGGNYWFVTSYIVLILLFPIINPYFSSLSKNYFMRLILIQYLLGYSLGFLLGAPFYILQKGLFFYSIGAYIRLFWKEKYYNKLIFIVTFCLGWIFGGTIAFWIATVGSQYEGGKVLFLILETLENCLAIPLCSVSFFLIFRSIDIGTINLINLISKTTFGIYLIHDSYIMRNLIWHSVFNVENTLYKLDIFPLMVPIIVIVVFLCCSIIDLIRIRYLEKKFMTMIQNIKEKYWNF